MTAPAETHIVGISLEGAVLPHFHLSEGFPALQTVGEFERTVFHHFGIETAVAGKVDVFIEDAVHRLLDGSTGLRCVQREGVIGSLHPGAAGQCGKCQKVFLEIHKAVVL